MVLFVNKNDEATWNVANESYKQKCLPNYPEDVRQQMSINSS